jgi:hypothetical protein
MPPEAVKIRKLPVEVVEAHRRRAENEGISLEEELRRLVIDSALKPQRDFAAKAAAYNARLKAEYGTLSDSVEVIREERREREDNQAGRDVG